MFEINVIRFYFIDILGIGYCRGIEKDKENFENIFFICYNKFNVVVVFFKLNNVRLIVVFKFCVLELLINFYKFLVFNIIFVFINFRGIFYRLGDSLLVFKKLLEMYKIGINLFLLNYFCFDNKVFS